METPKEFDDIRPYNPEELPQIYEELINDEEFIKAMSFVFPTMPFEKIAFMMRKCKTSLAFQATFCLPFLNDLVNKYSSGISIDYEPDHTIPANLYISNHRDIVLDSAFLSLLLINKTHNTVEIAIGDNLLIRPWIKKLVRINRSFIVQRSVSMREILLSSQRLSKYIHYTINEKNEPIWLAQREGRSKDSTDHTQESVLKMLSMYSKGNPIDALKSLYIIPTTISYEYDPCDWLKAQEFQLKRDIPDFKKSQKDDLINMQTGMFGYKGKIHYHMSRCLNYELEKIPLDTPKTKLFPMIAEIIDKEIHSKYRLYPINYFCYEILTGEKQYIDKLNDKERENCSNYIDKQLSKIDISQKDENFLKRKIVEMYANPAINLIKATSK